MNVLLAFILPISLLAQIECSPYFPVTNYEVSTDVLYSIAYISCWHARGITAEVGTRSIQLGSTIMGKRHENSAYIFTQYSKDFDLFRVYGGCIYRVNNDPALGIARVGIDAKLYESLYFTLSLSQLSRTLSYSNFGLKLIM